MKKYLIGVLVVFAFVSLVGCGKKEDNSKTDYMILVNKQNKLPDDWEDRIELVDYTNGLGETVKIEKKAAKAFEELREDLKKEYSDFVIEADSTYRSVARQQEIWDQFLQEHGEEYTKKYVAVPGTSEHHTGLAIDIKLDKNGTIVYDNDEMTAEKEIFSKIHAKLADYGFILRYPEGKEDITGYGAEVWHFRYIDDKEIAKKIMDEGITLEEYLKK